MYQEGHYGTALLAAASIVLVGGAAVSIICIPVLMAFTMVPDLDQRTNFITHRGITHTVLFAGIIGVLVGGGITSWFQFVVAEFTTVFGIFPWDLQPVRLGILTGAAATFSILVHIFTDTLTVGSGAFGVKPFWPFSRQQVRFGLCKASNSVANHSLFGAGTVVFTAAVWFRLQFPYIPSLSSFLGMGL